MPDCKNTIDYFKTKKRLCESLGDRLKCDECPLSTEYRGDILDCHYVEENEPEKAVEILQKWAAENPELEPCPFCGNEARLYKESSFAYNVGCYGCGIGTLNYTNAGSAIKTWNNRINLYPTGRWIKQPDGSTICSHCNKGVKNNKGETVNCSHLPYCPKCGARMTEVELCAND